MQEEERRGNLRPTGRYFIRFVVLEEQPSGVFWWRVEPWSMASMPGPHWL